MFAYVVFWGPSFGSGTVGLWFWGPGLRIEAGGSRVGPNASNYPAPYPDFREDPKSRSLNGGSYKVPLVV